MYRIRDGDTLHVHYNSEADVQDILDIIAAMKEMVSFLESIQPNLSKKIPKRQLVIQISRSIKATTVMSLDRNYFYPYSTERANANRLLFVNSGGLDLMHQLHVVLLKQPWRNTPVEMQYLEDAILQTLWNITGSFSVRTLVLERPTLEAISHSLLRVKIGWKKVIKAPSNLYIRRRSAQPELNYILSEMIYKAVGTICK